jgi:hypothetical protein
MLLEERVNVLSDIGNNSMYVMNTTTLSVEDVQNVEESVVVNETETA